ncbi:unnamed protein product, partial [Urochloa humidicola]
WRLLHLQLAQVYNNRRDHQGLMQQLHHHQEQLLAHQEQRQLHHQQEQHQLLLHHQEYQHQLNRLQIVSQGAGVVASSTCCLVIIT